MCMSVVSAFIYMCTTRMAGAHEGQKSGSDLLELELWPVLSYQVGAGDQIWVPHKNKCSYPLSLLSSP